MNILVALPVLTVALASYVLRPYRSTVVVGARRLAVLRGCVAVGAFAIVGVELLSLVGALSTAGVISLWITGIVVTAVLAEVRRRRDADAQPSTPVDSERATWVEKLLVGAVAGLLLAELVLALAAYPNTWDSLHYHLTKVERWVANGDVEVYATSQLPQVMFAPGAEYLLLHLRLLTGGDGLYNLVQWGAGVVAVLAVSRITAQLGAGRLAQLLAATVIATAPMVVLQSTSTQTDLAVSAWLVCAASFALDGAGRLRVGDLLALGAASGLTVITKFTGLAGLAPVLLLWGLRHLWTAWRGEDRARRVGLLAAASAAVIAVALLLTGPFLVRADRAFGHPLGTPQYRSNLSMQRYDPAALTVNATRIASSTLITPVSTVNVAVADAVTGLSTALGIDASDPAITMQRAAYPSLRWKPDEDHSPYPLHSALLLLAVAVTLAARRVPHLTRAYGLVTLGTLIMFSATLKWQPWGNRLVLPALVLGAPLIGYWLAKLCTRTPLSTGAERLSTGRRAGVVAVALIVTVSLVIGYGTVLLGWPRRLVGPYSVFTTVEWDERFARQGHLRESYRFAAAQVRDAGAQKIGIVVDGDGWEYPFWLLLPGRELVSLESAVPTKKPASTADVDAIVCVGPADRCGPHLAPTWRWLTRDNWVYAGLPAP